MATATKHVLDRGRQGRDRSNTVVVQALLDNLLARGLDPTLPRLFIVDGAKALSNSDPQRCGSVWPPPSSDARSTRLP